MTMMIGKFHKLIGNKVFWWGFALLISVSMVGLFTPGQSWSGAMGDQNNAGQLDGEDVTAIEFSTQRNYVQLSGALRNRPATQSIEDDEVWIRIGQLKKAESMGIHISDQDVKQAIHGLELFNQEGQFSQQAYQQILYGIGREFGISAKGFEEFIRQEYAITRLEQLLISTVWVAPSEVKRIFENLNDLFSVEFTTFTESNLTAAAEVSDEELESFYNKNQESFRKPPQVNVHYVVLPFDSFTNAVEISEEEVTQIYSNNVDQFVKEQEVEVPAIGSNEVQTITVYTNMEPQEAYTKIRESIAQRRARDLALDKGTEISIVVAQENPDFAAVVEKEGLELLESGFFNEKASVSDLDPASRFNEFSFGLGTNQDVRISDALLASNAVYVAWLIEKKESTIQPLSEVQDIVQAACEAQATRRKVTEEANAKRSAILKAVEAGKTFAEAVSENGLTLSTIEKFTRSGEELSEQAEGRSIGQAITNLRKGDTSEFLPASQGLVLIHVTQREAGDWSKFEEQQEYIESTMTRGRASVILNEFQKNLISADRLKSNRKDPDALEVVTEVIDS